jgi:transposase-like protein
LTFEFFTETVTKDIKTEANLNDFRQVLTKITVEVALNSELEAHLGYHSFS